ncbi:TonB-dependent receptor [Deltaproteobacteria bacterium]|nr:TonB-dependent receptor [Deltaproteobacteria bacterium]
MKQRSAVGRFGLSFAGFLCLVLPKAGLAEEPAPPQAPGAVEELPPLVKDPALLQFVQAPYPEAAQAARIEGTVTLVLEIDATGAVTRVDVAVPAGNGFDEAAVEAAKQFKFSPAEDASGPVPVAVEFAYGFVLDAAAVEGARPDEAAAAAASAEAPITLEGTVVEMGTRRPVADFLIRVEPVGAEVQTDAEGRWQLRGLPAGTYTIRAVRPGYDTLQKSVDIVEGQATSARLWVRNQSYADPGILGTYHKDSADVTRRTISMDEVRRIPGTFGDPVRVIQSLPGAARAPLGSGVLIIRGSNPEDSRVYVDGMYIPYIYHLGGFESVINPDLVGSVDYLPGGYGPQYGRSTGGTVDVATRNRFPERTELRWSTDALDSGGVVLGSFGKEDQHGFGAAARLSYIDAILPAFLADDGFTVIPRWWDFQTKYQYQGDKPDKFSVIAFGFRDTLLLHTPDGYAQGTDQDTQGDVGTEYNTYRLGVNWDRSLGKHWALHASPSFGSDYAALDIGDAFHLIQSRYTFEVRADAKYTLNDHFTATAGIDFIAGWADFVIELPFNPATFAEIDPIADREPYALEDNATGFGPDPWLNVAWKPLENPDTLALNAGARLMYVIIPGENEVLAFDPRFSFRVQALPGTVIKGSTGLYHQPPQPFQQYRPDDKPVEVGAEQAWASSVGIEQSIGPAIRVEVEGFYKDLTDLIVGNRDFGSLNDSYFVNAGVGRAYGVEVIARHEPIGNLFGWVSYTLSRSERQDYPDEEWYPFDFDQTHILSAVASYRLPYDLSVGAKVQYTTGNPTTPYSLGVYDVDQDTYMAFQTGAGNSERLPAFWAVSARIDKLFTFKSWQLLLYIDVINALHGENPEFEQYNYDYTEKTYFAGLPIIPSPGFEVKVEF